MTKRDDTTKTFFHTISNTLNNLSYLYLNIPKHSLLTLLPYYKHPTRQKCTIVSINTLPSSISWYPTIHANTLIHNTKSVQELDSLPLIIYPPITKPEYKARLHVKNGAESHSLSLSLCVSTHDWPNSRPKQRTSMRKQRNINRTVDFQRFGKTLRERESERGYNPQNVDRLIAQRTTRSKIRGHA